MLGLWIALSILLFFVIVFAGVGIYSVFSLRSHYKNQILPKDELLSSENNFIKFVGGEKELALIEWSRRNDLLHLKELYDVNRKAEKKSGWLFYSRFEEIEARAMTYLFFKNANYCGLNTFRNIHPQKDIGADAKIIDAMIRVLEIIGLYDAKTDVLSVMSNNLKTINPQNQQLENKCEYPKKLSYEDLLGEFITSCEFLGIGILFSNVNDKHNYLHDMMIDLIEKSDHVAFTANTPCEFLRKSISQNKIYRLILGPLDYYGHFVRYPFKSTNTEYFGLKYLFDNLASSSCDINSILDNNHSYINQSLFIDSYVATGGQTFFYSTVDDLLRSYNKDKLIRLYDNYVLYDKAFHCCYDNIMKELHQKEKQLLNLIALLPFSVSENDFYAFCKFVKIDNPILLKDKLLYMELLYETSRKDYFDLPSEVDSEFKCFGLSSSLGIPIARDEYFAKLKTNVLDKNIFYEDTIKKLNDVFKNDKIAVVSILKNYKQIQFSLDILIKYSLIHRFNSNDYGLFIAELTKNIIIRYGDNNKLKENCEYLCNYYNALANQSHDDELRFIALVINYFYGNVNEITFCEAFSELLNKTNDKGFSKECDKNMPYFSKTFRRMINLDVNYTIRRRYLDFSLRHLCANNHSLLLKATLQEM